ncbi:MAG: hypothetical protein IJH83_04540 [Coriobacteriales bacterium]|nr:hypothetical protein [Coriobacteriales bacterium]
MGKFDGHEELHDIYPEFNPPIEKMLGHKTKTPKARFLNALLTVAVVAAMSPVFLNPSFAAHLTQLEQTTARVDVKARLGLSQYDYPIEYRLYQLRDIDWQLDSNGNHLYSAIELDPRPPQDKYTIERLVQAGPIEQVNTQLYFEGLEPGATYLVLLYQDSEAIDLIEAFDCELVFSLPAAPPAPPEPIPPAPEPIPPAPQPEPEPQQLPPPDDYEPYPETTPIIIDPPIYPDDPPAEPDTPPDEPDEPPIKITATPDIYGYRTFSTDVPQPTIDTYNATLSFPDGLGDVQDLVAFDAASQAPNTSGRLYVYVDKGTANERILEIRPGDPSVTIDHDADGRVTGVTISDSTEVTPDGMTEGSHTLSAEIVVLDDDAGETSYESDEASFDVSLMAMPGVTFNVDDVWAYHYVGTPGGYTVQIEYSVYVDELEIPVGTSSFLDELYDNGGSFFLSLCNRSTGLSDGADTDTDDGSVYTAYYAQYGTSWDDGSDADYFLSEFYDASTETLTIPYILEITYEFDVTHNGETVTYENRPGEEGTLTCHMDPP